MQKQFHELIEEAPSYCTGVADLANWSTNYDHHGGTPFLAFLDLIGYTEEAFGCKLNPSSFVLDYASAESFAAAINEWSVRPPDVNQFIDELMGAD